VLAAESTQASLDQSLDHVEQQQRHLTATLDQYEKSASEILHGPGGIMSSTEGLGLADSERDKRYVMITRTQGYFNHRFIILPAMLWLQIYTPNSMISLVP
jgi:Nsp1-like C-terminal region